MTKYAAILCIFLTGIINSRVLAVDTILTLNVTKQSDNLVRLSGKTNLPPGTKLMLSVSEKMENGFFGQSSCLVSRDGTFQSEAFGPDGGLNDGRYLAEVTMPVPSVQTAQIKRIEPPQRVTDVLVT